MSILKNNNNIHIYIIIIIMAIVYRPSAISVVQHTHTQKKTNHSLSLEYRFWQQIAASRVKCPMAAYRSITRDVVPGK